MDMEREDTQVYRFKNFQLLKKKKKLIDILGAIELSQLKGRGNRAEAKDRILEYINNNMVEERQKSNDKGGASKV